MSRQSKDTSASISIGPIVFFFLFFSRSVISMTIASSSDDTTLTRTARGSVSTWQRTHRILSFNDKTKAIKMAQPNRMSVIYVKKTHTHSAAVLTTRTLVAHARTHSRTSPMGRTRKLWPERNVQIPRLESKLTRSSEVKKFAFRFGIYSLRHFANRTTSAEKKNTSHKCRTME